MENISIFASGNGSNAEQIIKYFYQSIIVKIAIIIVNKKNAGVIKIAQKYNIPYLFVENKELENKEFITKLNTYFISLIVLAGFLYKIPNQIITNYTVINIHPSLLPKYGGKGMYGENVHKAVLKAKEKHSGITIHYVNKEYDKGKIIFQKKCVIEPTDDVNLLTKRVLKLEHTFYPKIIENIINNLKK